MPALTPEQRVEIDQEERIQWLEYMFDRLKFGRLGTTQGPWDVGQLGPPTPGADINVTYPTAVSRSGDHILLFSGSALVLREYAFNAAGIALAIAAQTSGDVIWLPAGTLTADFTIPTGGIIIGRSRGGSVVAGKITLGSGSRLENMSITRTSSDAAALIGVTIGDTGTGTLVGVRISVANSVGAAYAIYMNLGGNINCHNTELLAQTGTNGYAAYVSSGTFNHYSGRAVGTVATYPYYI